MDAAIAPFVETYGDNPARVVIYSYGHRHGTPPEVDLAFDLRRRFRDPHVDPALRERTGLDWDIITRVLATPGISGLVGSTTGTVLRLLDDLPRETVEVPVRVGVGCAGGRHRSVVVARSLASALWGAGVPVRVEHRDITRPVLTST